MNQRSIFFSIEEYGAMELPLKQKLKESVEAHKASRAQEADRYYTAILKVNFKHPAVNHNMGVLTVGVWRVGEALPFFEIAIKSEC